MEKALIHNAQASPDNTAIIDGGITLSYRKLIHQADLIVRALHEKGLQESESVAIVFESGYRQVISQVAVLRAGGTSVPVEPSMPPLRLIDMLNDINARYIISFSDLARDLLGFTIIDFDATTDPTTPVDVDSDISLRANRDSTHRSHILFTSGSTGRPKPIQVMAGSILHVIEKCPASPASHSDRTGMITNPGFDLSLFGLWGGLISGATCVQIPKLIAIDPTTLGSFISEHKITFIVVPTALFNVIALSAPGSFTNCRHVLVGGEAANATAMRTVLSSGPPKNLWNAYGPTEATICVTMNRVQLAEAEGPRISIGQPFGENRIYLLDEHHKPITGSGQRGEISVAGPQVSPGYLGRPQETQQAFIEVPGAVLGEEEVSVRLYRTGDLGEWGDARRLDYIGRADKQIKRFGHRVELGDIERTLEAHPSVHACVVRQHKQETSERLVAYVVFNSWTNKATSEDLTTLAKERLPPYMVPDVIKPLEEFPLTANGKVDRDALLPDMDAPAVEVEETRSSHTNDLGQKLREKLQGYLNLQSIADQDNIFSIGLTSLQAARLVGAISIEYGRTITLAQLYQNPTISNLKSFLLQSCDEKKVSIDEQIQQWEDDTRIADHVVSPPDWQSDTEGRVFITGATGFVGAFLINELLSMPTVKKVACLARSRGKLTAADRIQKALERYNLWDGSLEKAQKIMVLDGDLSDETLRLGHDQYEWLAKWASVIFHIGARVNWCEPYEAHFDANVVGTLNVIRLANDGRRKALHYLSSIDAWNVTGLINNTERVLEDGSLIPHRNSLPYDIGYAQSQWVADEMVQRAMRRGLPAAIHRPGFIIGDSQLARGNPDDFFTRFIIACIQMGYYPHLPQQRLEYVTIDYVVSAMVHISTNNDNLGHAYHLVSLDPADSVTIEGTYNLLKQIGYAIEEISYSEWVGKVRQAEGGPLEPMLPMLQEPVLDGMTRVQTSRQTPVYDARNTARALADRPDIKYVPLDSQLLQSFVEFQVKRGYYTLFPSYC